MLKFSVTDEANWQLLGESEVQNPASHGGNLVSEIRRANTHSYSALRLSRVS